MHRARSKKKKKKNGAIFFKSKEERKTKKSKKRRKKNVSARRTINSIVRSAESACLLSFFFCLPALNIRKGTERLGKGRGGEEKGDQIYVVAAEDQ